MTFAQKSRYRIYFWWNILVLAIGAVVVYEYLTWVYCCNWKRPWRADRGIVTYDCLAFITYNIHLPMLTYNIHLPSHATCDWSNKHTNTNISNLLHINYSIVIFCKYTTSSQQEIIKCSLRRVRLFRLLRPPDVVLPSRLPVAVLELDSWVGGCLALWRVKGGRCEISLPDRRAWALDVTSRL